MQQAVAELGLGPVTVVHARVEDYHPESAFDVILSRAFASAGDFVAAVSHLGKQDCLLMSMKTQISDAEMQALKVDDFSLRTIPLNVPGIHQPRSLITLSRRV